MKIKIKLHALKAWYLYIDRAIITMADGKLLVLDTEQYAMFPFHYISNEKGDDYGWETGIGYSLELSSGLDVEIHLHDYGWDLQILQKNVIAQMELLNKKSGLAIAVVGSEEVG